MPTVLSPDAVAAAVEALVYVVTTAVAFWSAVFVRP
jgi:hypothetical protein